MGTSGSYGGAGNGSPLIPGFLNDPAPASAPMLPAPAPPTAPNALPVPNTMPSAPVIPMPSQPQPRPVPQQAPMPNRFTAPRSNFSRFARSGGTDRSALGRAVSGYVSTAAGGSRQAVRRMGASRQAGARLYSFLADAEARGPVEALRSLNLQALRSLNLQALAGRPVEEIFLGIAEYVCPIGGTVDEGIARDSFIETIADLADQGISDFDSLTPDQMQTVFEMFATHAIEARICNDIGKNSIKLPTDIAAVERVQAQLHDFIGRAVSDALGAAQAATGLLTEQQAQQHVDAVYEAAFDMLQTLGDAESEL
jgi:hypothetical protein